MAHKIYDNKEYRPGAKFSGVQYRGEGKSRKSLITFYDQMINMVDDVETNGCEGGNRTWLSTMFETYGSWTFGTDYPNLQECKKAVKYGVTKDNIINTIDKKKFDLMQKYPELAELERHAATKKRRKVFREFGEELSIDRVMTGDPECWQQSNKIDIKKSVRLMINIGMNYGVEADKFMANMIAFAAICDIFQTAGISVEIIVGAFSKHDHSSPIFNFHSIIIKLKDAGQPLDFSTLLSCGIPGFFRYYCFYLISNVVPEMHDAGLGSAVHQYSEEVRWVKETMDIDIIVNPNDFDNNQSIIFNQVQKILNNDSSN